MNGVKTFVTFVKKETAFCIAGLLAVVSMFFTPPSALLLAGVPIPLAQTGNVY